MLAPKEKLIYNRLILHISNKKIEKYCKSIEIKPELVEKYLSMAI